MSSHLPHETLPKPMLVEVSANFTSTSSIEIGMKAANFTSASSIEIGMKGMAVAKKISFGEPWYLVLINEKLLWFRSLEIQEIENAQ